MPEHGIKHTSTIDDKPDFPDFSESLREFRQQARAETERQEAAQSAQIKMSEQLADISKRLDQEREERLAAHKSSTKENRIWQTATITIGLLTLAATVLFGILALLN